MRLARRLAAAGALALLMTAAAAAQAAVADDPGTAWDAPSVSAEYGEYWQLSATAPNGEATFGPWTASGTLSNTPSGYVPSFTAFQSDPSTVVAYAGPQIGGRPLGAGTYTATLTLTEANGTGPSYTSGPATLTITPAALTMTLTVIADPSNPSNAIISSELTGSFRDNFFTASYPDGPLGPAGTWKITATGEDGEVAHEATVERPDTSDIMGVSSYWSDVAPGSYVVSATFTPSGSAAGNFAITAPADVTYTAAPAPGATSTATPAPPAPPATADDTGMTLPGWVPLVAGVVSAGLLALTIVQAVRLRRAGTPARPDALGGEA
jgi:hypothetical protein